MGQPASESDRMERKHVFVINGQVEFLNVMRELFQDERYNVTTTNFLPETFEHVLAVKPAVVVIDLAFGVQAGWDLLEQFQQEALTNDIPIVVVSTDRKLLERARQEQEHYGIHRFLAKPFDLDEILGAVEQLVGKA